MRSYLIAQDTISNFLGSNMIEDSVRKSHTDGNPVSDHYTTTDVINSFE